MDTISKKYYIIGAVVLVLIVVGGIFLMNRNNTPQNAEQKESVFEEPDEVIPTVDPSVKVSIKGTTDAVVTIEGIPDGTETIEYELSYSTKSGSMEGAIGLIQVEGSEAEEEVTFGTCSSGVCRYHEISGPVTGNFIFEGSYGKRMLEQEFTLE